MGNWKTCKFCKKENGNSVTQCKSCGNDKFWTRPNKRSFVEEKFEMKPEWERI